MIDSENLGIRGDSQLRDFFIIELSLILINWGILK